MTCNCRSFSANEPRKHWFILDNGLQFSGLYAPLPSLYVCMYICTTSVCMRVHDDAHSRA
jgi:hypothetical protein